MRLLLEVQSGPHAGRRVSLERGQVLTVGRTQRSDFVLAADALISSRHFELQCDDRGAQLRDLSSTNGTVLNGQPVSSARLRNGDQIRVGDTVLVVTFDASGGEPVIEEPPPQAPRFSHETLSQQVVCTSQPCESGLVRLAGPVEPPVAAVVFRLSQSVPAYVVADYRRLEITLRESQTLGESLFNWMAPEVANLAPRILTDVDAWQPLLETAWGRDGLAVVFSRQPLEQVVAHLRNAACYDPNLRQPRPGRSLWGYFWPSVGRTLFAHMQPPTAADVCADTIEGILFEAAPPDAWQLYATPVLVEMLKKLGWKIEATSPPSEAITA